MNIHLATRLLLLHVSALGLLAQTQPFAVSAGASPPSIILAPGALTTIYVIGLNLNGQSYVASGLPLPLELGGVSATVSPSGPNALPVPMYSVAAVPGSPQFTAVTIEVPYEIFPNYVGLPYMGAVTVSEDGIAGQSIPSLFVESNVQLIKNCVAAITEAPAALQIETCSAAAQHADGSAISSMSPAQRGEHIVLYALGLGNTTPPVPDGLAASQPSPIALPLYLDLNFEANAAAISGVGFASTYQADYAGLAPGYVGLYQVNMTLPATFPSGLPACGATVATNLTITIDVAGSLDGSGICVNPAP